jgi:hypothetical protein
MSLVDARWVGPAGMVLVDGTNLEPGVTVVQISEGEATESDNWEIVAPTSKRSSSTTVEANTSEGDA